MHQALRTGGGVFVPCMLDMGVNIASSVTMLAFYDGDEKLPFGKWHLATQAIVHVGGHKGDQEQRGLAIVCTRLIHVEVRGLK